MTVHERHKCPIPETHLAVNSARKNGEQEEEEEGGGAGGEANHTPSKQVLRQPT